MYSDTPNQIFILNLFTAVEIGAAGVCYLLGYSPYEGAAFGATMIVAMTTHLVGEKFGGVALLYLLVGLMTLMSMVGVLVEPTNAIFVRLFWQSECVLHAMLWMALFFDWRDDRKSEAHGALTWRELGRGALMTMPAVASVIWAVGSAVVRLSPSRGR